MEFCGNLYIYVGVFGEAKRTLLLVLASTKIDKTHGGRLELLTSIYKIYMIRSEVDFFENRNNSTGFRPLTVGNLFTVALSGAVKHLRPYI